MRDDLDLVVRHLIDAAQQLAALLGHHDDLRRRLDDALHHRALRRRRIGQHGVERRHDRHGQARQQHEDVGAGFAAENSEFVLQAHDVEPAGIQEVCRAHVVFDIVVLDLQSDRRRIVVGLTMIGHRHDAGLEVRARSRYRLLQVGRKGCDSAAAGQRIADNGDTAERRHVCTSTISLISASVRRTCRQIWSLFSRFLQQRHDGIRSRIGDQTAHPVGPDFDAGTIRLDEDGVADRRVRSTRSARVPRSPGSRFPARH